jgi:hypothetical protein
MDFQDFLRHKFAHVAIGEFKPGKFAIAKQIYEEAVSTYTTGFKGVRYTRRGTALFPTRDYIMLYRI